MDARRFLVPPNLVAITIALTAFAALYWVMSFGLSTLINWGFFADIGKDPADVIAATIWWKLLGYALYLIPGFVVGFLASRAGLLHGLIVGVLTVPVMFSFLFIGGFSSVLDVRTVSYGLAIGVLWCSLAGILGEFAAAKLRRT